MSHEFHTENNIELKNIYINIKNKTTNHYLLFLLIATKIPMVKVQMKMEIVVVLVVVLKTVGVCWPRKSKTRSELEKLKLIFH